MGCLLLQDQSKWYLWSVNNIVILAASTGNVSNNITLIIRTCQTNSGVWYWDTVGGFLLIIVVTKLIAPKVSEEPAQCNEKIVKYTEAPVWTELLAKSSWWQYNQKNHSTN